ncbi:hypothetical protein HYV79_05045 [Candidatus Woesearchaeota archaeon]|nr:hypothetical protein [Candidatus Woesearchaeota archaeon]
MVTPLDLTGLKYFENLFTFLFVIVLTFVVLTRFDLFKEKNGFAALISLFLAVMTMLFPIAVRTLTLAAPWFVLVFLLSVLVLLCYSAFGVEQTKIMTILTDSEYSQAFAWWIIGISLIIIIGSVSKAISEQEGFLKLTQGERLEKLPPEEAGFFATILHPKMLGLILLLLVALFTIKQLAEGSSRAS